MGAWVLVTEKRKTLEEINNVNYYELTQQERLDVLMAVLDSNYFEVYYRNSGSICVYSIIFEDFYTESGIAENNLLNFWNNVIKLIHSELDTNQSEYKIQQLETV